MFIFSENYHDVQTIENRGMAVYLKRRKAGSTLRKKILTHIRYSVGDS